MELAGRLAVVTGGASGIGAATVERLAAAGARPVVWDVGDGADVRCDVADPASVEAAVAETVERHGAPTILAACAGVGSSGWLTEVTPEEWQRVLGVNLTGVWLTMRALHEPMAAAGGGAMVVVTSVDAHLADAYMGAYCVSKAGAEMLLRVAATEWAEDGIRVNGVGPGITKTPMLGGGAEAGAFEGARKRTPLGRLGEPDDIADVIVALLQLEWVTGQNVMADGGLTLYSPVDMRGAGLRRPSR